MAIEEGDRCPPHYPLQSCARSCSPPGCGLRAVRHHLREQPTTNQPPNQPTNQQRSTLDGLLPLCPTFTISSFAPFIPSQPLLHPANLVPGSGPVWRPGYRETCGGEDRPAVLLGGEAPCRQGAGTTPPSVSLPSMSQTSDRCPGVPFLLRETQQADGLVQHQNRPLQLGAMVYQFRVAASNLLGGGEGMGEDRRDLFRYIHHCVMHM